MGILFNKRYFDENIDFDGKFNNLDVISLYGSKVTLLDLVYHEMGHFIYQCLCHNDEKLWNSKIPAKNIVKSAYKRLQDNNKVKNKSLSDVIEDISNYAKENDVECLAEAIRDVYQNKDKAKVLSKEIFNILKECFNK